MSISAAPIAFTISSSRLCSQSTKWLQAHALDAFESGIDRQRTFVGRRSFAVRFQLREGTAPRGLGKDRALVVAGERMARITASVREECRGFPGQVECHGVSASANRLWTCLITSSRCRPSKTPGAALLICWRYCPFSPTSCLRRASTAYRNLACNSFAKPVPASLYIPITATSRIGAWGRYVVVGAGRHVSR